jgi:hypothetical protein|tara:strand:+ start:192 stop:455 length:264 start_codon:yes stop_codon:yes gene_type:complete
VTGFGAGAGGHELGQAGHTGGTICDFRMYISSSPEGIIRLGTPMLFLGVLFVVLLSWKPSYVIFARHEQNASDSKRMINIFNVDNFI